MKSSHVLPIIELLHRAELVPSATAVLSPLTRSIIEQAETSIQSRLQALQQTSLFTRWRLVLALIHGKGTYKQDFERLAGHSTATLADTLAALQSLYVAWIPLAVTCAELSEQPRRMLQARGVATPDAHIFSDTQKYCGDVLSLWGIVHEFPTLVPMLERSSTPTSSDEGGIFFRSAWLWFKRRQMWQVVEENNKFKADIDIAAPRVYELLDGRETEILQQFTRTEQPFAKFREWTWSDQPLTKRLLWRWLEYGTAAQDAVHRTGREVLCGLRLQVQRHAQTAMQQGRIANADDLWSLTLNEARNLAAVIDAVR
jgi:hypothetical protein